MTLGGAKLNINPELARMVGDGYGNIGKGLGGAFSQIGQQKIDKQKREQEQLLNNTKMNYYDTQNTQMKRDGVLKQKKFASDQRERLAQKAKTDNEYKSKVKLGREALEKIGVDTSSYSNDDIYYGGESLNEIHTDPTDFKFSGQLVYDPNGMAHALMVNKKGEHKVVPLFGDSVGQPIDNVNIFEENGLKRFNAMTPQMQEKVMESIQKDLGNKVLDKKGVFDSNVKMDHTPITKVEVVQQPTISKGTKNKTPSKKTPKKNEIKLQMGKNVRGEDMSLMEGIRSRLGFKY
jgi:hypothetical protein